MLATAAALLVDEAIGKSYKSSRSGNYGYYSGGYYNYNSYNSYSGNSLMYTGSAWGVNSAGEYALIPTTQCPYKCSIDMVCGTETQCELGSVVLVVFLSIFGAIALCFIVKFCCVCCNARNAVKEDDDYKRVDENNLDGPPPTTTYAVNTTYYNAAAVNPNIATPQMYQQPGTFQQQPAPPLQGYT